MTRRRLPTRLGAVERRRGQVAGRPVVWYIEDVRPGEEGQRDRARGVEAAMRAQVQDELVASGQHNVHSLITTSVITEGEGIAEAAGRTWWFVLAADGAGGTRATVMKREAAAWVR